MADRTHFKVTDNDIKDSVSFGDSKPLNKVISDLTVVKDGNDNSKINNLIQNANNILVIVKGEANDAVGSGVALALYCETKYGKSPDLIYLGDVEGLSQELIDTYEIKTELEKVILKIELDYNDTEIESCEWYKDDGNKKLVFEIKPIHKGFGTKRIKYKEEGLGYDLIITIGLNSLEDIGDVYRPNKHYFKSVDVINFDNSSSNLKFGKVNVVDNSSEFLSKIIFDRFIEWKFVPNIVISRALLLGLGG